MDRTQGYVGGLRRLIPFALAVAALLTWTDLHVRVIGPALEAQHYPGSVYWVGPRLVWEGRGLTLLDADMFADAARAMGANSDLGFLPFAPAAVLLLLPFGLLPEGPAYFLWTAAGVATLLASLAILLETLRPPRTLALLILAAVPIFHPLRANFVVGQAYALVLLALVVYARLGYASPPGRRRVAEPLAAIGAGFIAVLKTNYGILLLLPALITRRWIVIALTAGFFIIAAALTLPIVGLDGWTAWAESALTWRSRPETSATAYQTVHSLLAHLLRRDAPWNLAPVVDLPLVADVLWYAAVAVLVLASAWVMVRSHSSSAGSTAESPARRLLPVALVVPVASLISPIAEDYHYLLSLLPLLVGVTVLWAERPPDRLAWLCFGAAVVLLAPAWPFKDQTVDGWWALLFYPRVYGAFLLWLALASLMVRNKRDGRAVVVS